MTQIHPHTYAIASLHVALQEAVDAIHLLSGCSAEEIQYRLLLRSFNRLEQYSPEQIHAIAVSVVESSEMEPFISAPPIAPPPPSQFFNRMSA
jgi:hypothetical protein